MASVLGEGVWVLILGFSYLLPFQVLHKASLLQALSCVALYIAYQPLPVLHHWRGDLLVSVGRKIVSNFSGLNSDGSFTGGLPSN